jgi:hypothetical protein
MMHQASLGVKVKFAVGDAQEPGGERKRTPGMAALVGTADGAIMIGRVKSEAGVLSGDRRRRSALSGA